MTMNTAKPAQSAFRDLEDGEIFHLAMSIRLPTIMKCVKDCVHYNAVIVDSPRRPMTIPADTQVVRVKQPEAIPVPVAEPEKHPSDAFTLVMLKSSMYMFDKRELTGGEWAELQLDESIYTVPLALEGIAMLVNQRGEYCFIFWDEADQCSQPYPTVTAAKAARTHYAQKLISEACALADEMNDNMRKYGTIDKPAEL